jgi:hypothetical protein
MELSDRIEHQQAKMLFRVQDEERAEALWVVCCYCIMTGPPSGDGTESSFISFWDANIRRIMEALIPHGTSIRDSNRRTDTAALRPDFGFLYFNLCLFRGEEKSPTNTKSPRPELVDKMIWTYDPAPYVLG